MTSASTSTASSTLKSRIAGGDLTFGSWLNLGSAAAAEIMANAGFDWLVIDLEHSATTIRETESLIRVVSLAGSVPLVRLSSNDPVQIARVLDAGAEGVIVPRVNTAADARAAVAAATYPPMGARGVGIGRAHKYGPGFDEYVRSANQRTIVVAQIEHHRAVESLTDIAGVTGIDATMIGPYDLSASVGKPGNFDDPDVRSLLASYESTSRATGRTMGYHVVAPDPAIVRQRIDAGYRLIAFSVDFLFLGDSCRAALAAVRAAASDSTQVQGRPR